MKYLPRACAGEIIGGMCMSEPGAGTDVLGLSTTARKDGDDYILNGTKMWITNGCISDDEQGDVYLVYAPLATNRAISRCSWSRKVRRASASVSGSRTSAVCGHRRPPSWCFKTCACQQKIWLAWRMAPSSA